MVERVEALIQRGKDLVEKQVQLDVGWAEEGLRIALAARGHGSQGS